MDNEKQRSTLQQRISRSESVEDYGRRVKEFKEMRRSSIYSCRRRRWIGRRHRIIAAKGNVYNSTQFTFYARISRWIQSKSTPSRVLTSGLIPITTHYQYHLCMRTEDTVQVSIAFQITHSTESANSLSLPLPSLQECAGGNSETWG